MVDKITELAFDVMDANNKMLICEVQYNYLKISEGDDSILTKNAYHTFVESQGYNSMMLYKYMVEYFKQPNSNPYDDRLLKRKFPIKFDYQRDLFGGVQVSIHCGDGQIISNVDYFTGGYSGDVEEAEEKARNYIEEQLKYFRHN